jgi:hypothetical protein
MTNQVKFLPSNKRVTDNGLIDLNNTGWCNNGNAFTSLYYGFKRVFCAIDDITYVNDVIHVNPLPNKTVTFSPTYKLFPEKFLISSSTIEPLAIYYKFDSAKVTLHLYNIETASESEIYSYGLPSSHAASTVKNEIKDCQFLFGQFENRNYSDLFINCNFLNLDKVFLTRSNNYQVSHSLPSGLCSNSIKVGDFNGDKLSDLLCLGNKPKIISNIGDTFITSSNNNIINIDLQKSTYSQWNSAFVNSSTLYVGDFDNDGISDLLSLVSSPKLLFGNPYYGFISYNTKENGKFSFYSKGSWCNKQNDYLVIADFDNNGKDDILCASQGKTYLMFSYSKLIPSNRNPLNKAIQNIEIDLDNFVLESENNDVYTLYKSSPLICNASKIFDPSAYKTCAINAKNAVRNLQPFINLPKAVTYAFIKSQIHAQFNIDTDNYSKTKAVNSNFNQSYVRTKLISTKAEDASDTQNFMVPASWCKIIEPRYLVLEKYFTATGKIKAYYNNGELVKDNSILKTILSYSNISIQDSLNPQIVFDVRGKIEIETLDTINSKNCDLVNVTETLHKNFYLIQKSSEKRSFQVQVAAIDASSQIGNSQSCLTENVGNSAISKRLSYIANNRDVQTRLVPMNRTDIIDMHGYVYSGINFFPNNYVKENMDLAKHNPDHDSTKSVVFYNNSYKIISVITVNDDRCPRSTITTTFYDNNNNKIGTTIPYAGFDSIRSVKTEAITASDLVMMFSIYLHRELKFFIFFDYIKNAITNTLYRAASYDGHFNNVLLDNSLIVCYRPYQFELSVVKFNIVNNSLREVGSYNYIFNQPKLDFKLRNVDSNSFYLLWHHNDNKGIFLQKFNNNLEKVGNEKNIIGFPANFDADFYHNFGVITWQDISLVANKSHYFIQTMHNDTFINNENIFNTFGATVKEVEIVHFNSSTTSNSRIENIGYLLNILNGTDYLSVIYDYRLNPQSLTLNNYTGTNGLSISSSAFRNSNNTDLSSVYRDTDNDKLVLATINSEKESTLQKANSYFQEGTLILSALASSRQSCACICSVENKVKQLEYKVDKFRQYTQDLEKIGLKSESSAAKAIKSTSALLEKSVEKLRFLRAQLRSGAETLARIEAELGIKAARNALGDALGAEIKVLGKEIPIIDIIFAIQFIGEEIINVNNENGAVSTRTLRLNYQSFTTVDGASLSQIEDLEDVMNFVHQGLDATIPFIQQIGSIALRNYTAYTRSLICPRILSDSRVLSTVQSLRQLLEKDLHFQFINKYDGIICKNDNSLYQVYRHGSNIYICHNFDTNDPDKFCRIFIKILRDSSEFLLPFILAPLLANPITAIIAATIATLIISNALNDERTAEFCHIFTCMTTNNPVKIVFEVIQEIHHANIEQEIAANFKVELQNIKTEISNLISDLENSDSIWHKIGDIFGIFETIVTKIFLDGSGSVVGGWLYDKFNDVCHQHHTIDHTKLLHLSTHLIAGFISQKQELNVSSTSCNKMAQSPRCCSEPNDQVLNPLCLPHLIMTTATAYDFSNVINSQNKDTIEQYCSHGCELEEMGLNSLMAMLGGYYE